MAGSIRADDPLVNLREYRHLAPWSLRDLASLTAAILEAGAVRPINAVASASPSERTIRFYVTRGLVTAPDGRGTAAVYSYRHFLEVLAIKLRQMEGATLATIESELAAMTGDVIERRVAAALGPALPSPASLPLFAADQQPRGRAGQVLGMQATLTTRQTASPGSHNWRRVVVADGLELHVRDDHPLATRDNLDDTMADAVRLAAGRILSPSRNPGGRPSDTEGSV
jgi:DNA-binding transcriptional MerR regulator